MAIARQQAGRRRSSAEWRVIIEQFERSGMTAPAFCAQRGCHVETLRHWRRKFRARTTLGGRPEFVELRPSPLRASPFTAQPLQGRWTFEITFPDGTTARLSGFWAKTCSRSLIRTHS